MKYLTLILGFLFVGCGGSSAPPPTDASAVDATAEAPQADATPADVATEAPPADATAETPVADASGS